MLTRKQFELLRFIHERLKEAGVPPSFDEMKDALDLRSKSGIHRLITALGPDVERGAAPALRRHVLDTLAALPPGAAPRDRAAVMARLAWQNPRRAVH